ncbi:cytochrome P450 [Coralliovum pocilloporae]|uniref:cytochrome P450 n=1 Tax=Coralliovum pocilloporae TaxID=3066369 RepID=UPI0033077564
MKLGKELIERIEAGEPSYVPPFPPRSGRKRSLYELMLAFRRNMLSVFNKNDFTRRIYFRRILFRDVIICNCPELVQETFSAQHETFQQKSAQMVHSLKPLLGDGLFVSDRELWKQRRSAVAPIIHTRRVPGFAPVMSETIAEWSDLWQKHPEGTEIDVIAEMAELTAEIISRTVFGRKLGRASTSKIVAGFKTYQERVDQVDLLSLLGAPDWMPRPYHGIGIRNPLKRVHAEVDKIIEAHFKGEADDSDAMIAQLFSARTEDGEPLSKRAIRNEAIVIFMAGHETTANTLSWAWLNVSQSPRVRKKLHEELKTVLGGRPPCFEDVARLRYTRFIIEETLRLYPPVPMLARRALEDGRLEEHSYKKGSILLISPWLLHRNPRIWSEPDAFIPERFDTTIAPKPHKYSYIPFAIGPRICPGLTFGLTEAILILAGLAQKFSLDLKPGHQPEAVSRLTLRAGDRLPMILTKREDHHDA